MQHGALLPRPPPGLAPGAGLALLVHAGLFAALTLSVDWRMKSPEAVSAELWAAVPQTAAPRVEEAPAPAPVPAPPPPPPAPAPVEAPQPAPPPDAQIATERAEKRRLDNERKEQAVKAEAERKKLEAEQQKAEELRLARLRDEQMKRMLGSLSSGSSTGTASQDAAPSQAYVNRLIARIKQNVVFSDSVAGNPAAEVEVRAAPNGSIIARRLIKGSGNKEWDDAVLRAIDRTGTLPRDTDGRVPATIIVAFRPKE